MVQMKYEIFLRFFNDIFCGIKNIFEGTYLYNTFIPMTKMKEKMS